MSIKKERIISNDRLESFKGMRERILKDSTLSEDEREKMLINIDELIENELKYIEECNNADFVI